MKSIFPYINSVFLGLQVVQLKRDVDDLLCDIQPHAGDPLDVVDAVLEDAALLQAVVREAGEGAPQAGGELTHSVLHHGGQRGDGQPPDDTAGGGGAAGGVVRPRLGPASKLRPEVPGVIKSN